MFTFTKMFTKQTIGLFAIVFVFAFLASAPVAIEKTTSTIDNAVAAAFGPGDGGDGTGDSGGGCGGCGEADPDTESGGPGDGGDGTGDSGGDCCDGPGGDGPDGGHEDPSCLDPRAINTGQYGECVYPSVTCDYLKANGEVGTLTLPYGGGEVELTWESTNATDALLTPDGSSVPTDGETTVTVTSDTTFILDVSSVDGSGSCEIDIDVEDPQLDPVCSAFAITESSVAPGSDLTFNWSTQNVTSASIDNDIGPVEVNGTDEIFKASDTVGTYTYTLTFDGQTNATCKDTVVVEENPTPNAVTCAAHANFSVSPTSLPYTGGTVNLSWNTTNVASVKFDGVAVELASSTSRNVTADKTFVLEITGDSTTVGNTEQCLIPVIVGDPDPEDISCAANVPTWKASDTSISRGADVTLTWEAVGLDTIEINNDVLSETSDLDGSKIVSPSSDVQYVLTGKKGDQTITCDLDIDVSSGGGGGSSNPRCDFDASKTSINAGEEITLSWDNRYTRELTIFDGDEDDGIKIFETDDDDLVDEGSIKVRPTKSTTYTILVERGSKDRTCDVDIKVKNTVVLNSVRDQGTIAGISLTSVPYTGFEAGPMLTFIFYALLAIWGLFVAYVLVVRGDRVAGVSLAGAYPKNPIIGTDYSTVKVTGSETSEAAAYVGSVLAAAPAANTASTAPTNLPIGNDPIVGYAAASGVETTTSVTRDIDAELKELEDRAHDQHVLISSDAMRELVTLCPRSVGRMVYLDMVIAEAKVSYPSEDGWVVLNQERIETICKKRNIAFEKDAPPVQKSVAADIPEVSVPTNSGSLAEVIVTGNIAAAYQMIGNRPMIALADAASDLDAVYRVRKGEGVNISEMLRTESAQLSNEQIKDAIAALTGAIDGTYENEGEAVKMAILKATKALS